MDPEIDKTTFPGTANFTTNFSLDQNSFFVVERSRASDFELVESKKVAQLHWANKHMECLGGPGSSVSYAHNNGMASNGAFGSGRPIPWTRDFVNARTGADDLARVMFLPTPKAMRGKLDPNEVVQLDLLCDFCTNIAEEIDSAEASPTFRGQIAEKQGGSRAQISGSSASSQDLFDSARSGCHLCTIVLNMVKKTHLYASIAHWKWSYTVSPKTTHYYRPDGKVVQQIRSPFKLEMKLEFILRTELLENLTGSGSKPEHCSHNQLTVKLPVVFKSAEAEELRPLLCRPLLSVFTMSDEHISLAKTWGHGCFAEHPECPKYEPNWMPTRLIEILDKNNIRLVDTESLAAPVPYYALSYCWGEEPVLTTTGAVIQDFKSQILLEDLPLTIEDAITVVRRMGGHFLWVDSLCIIQDDLDDWAREAATMCDVYQNSYLTIVALGAHGATDGLFARRDPLAVTDCCLPSISANRVVPVRETVNNNYDTDFFRSNLEHRGWTFQERALAPRKLFFSSFIFWECATSFTVGKEEFPDAHEWRESTVDPYHRRPLPGEVVCVPIRLDAFGLYKVPEWLGQWYTDLFDFSGRDLTKATDRLTAIAGVISHRERASGRKTDYGVWLDFWPFDLLWSCLYGERAERLDGAPTWSWASLTAQVRPAFAVGKELLLVGRPRAAMLLGDAKTLVVEGRLLAMAYDESPLPKWSDRERDIRLKVGAGRLRKLEQLAIGVVPSSGPRQWRVCDMRTLDCCATLDVDVDDSAFPTECSHQKSGALRKSGYLMLPLTLQRNRLFSRETPVVECFGLALRPASAREGCYERFGVFKLTFDMGARRRYRLRLKIREGRIEEPKWPRDSWHRIRLV